MSRTAKIILSVSLLLNLLLAAVLAGNMMKCFNNPYRRHSIHEIAEAFPPESGRRFEEAMLRAKERSTPLFDRMSKAKEQATALLKATPFSKEKYLAKMHEIHDLHGEMLFFMAGNIATIAEELQPQEREALAGMLHHPPRPPGEF